MQIGKIYGLYCNADNGEMNSQFFTTRREAVEYLDVFKDEILDENDNELEAYTQIELIEVDLRNIGMLAERTYIYPVSSWEQDEYEDWYSWSDSTSLLRLMEH